MGEDELYKDLEPLIDDLGVKLVDFRLVRLKTGTNAQIVLFKEGGVGTNECADVYRLVLPRLEVLLTSQDIHLEVSSPGLGRVLRLPREYPIFLGKNVVVYLRGGKSHQGKLVEADGSEFQVLTKDGLVGLTYDNVQKTKLEESQEGS